MVSQEEKEIFKQCFAKWGIDSQLIMLMEESAELTQATTKLFRVAGNPNFNEKLSHFAEEIADIELMIDEFVDFWSLQELVQAWRSKKLERLKEILKNG